MHTAVKIQPHYGTLAHPVLHVLDASRSVVVVQNLLSEDSEERDDYVEDMLDTYAEMREEYYGSLEDKRMVNLANARAKPYKIDFVANPPPVPATLGVTVVDQYSVADVVKYIDWNRSILTQCDIY